MCDTATARVPWLMQYGNNVWHEVNYNSRLQPYQALDVINNDPNQLLRDECLY